MERKYERVVKFIQETPWAVKPEMLSTIRGIVAAKLQGVALEPVAAKKPEQPNQTVGGVGVLPLWGVMVPHAGMFSDISGGVALDTWLDDFRGMVNDPSISTIVLDVDSPGGSVAMVPEVAAEVRAARGKKRVVAVANPEMASAAYWLASQADEIVMPMSGMVGSVGVIAEHTDLSRMEEMQGVTHTYITAGDYKAEQLGPLSKEAQSEIQRKVNQFYGMFVADVAEGRGVSEDVVLETYGKGRMLTAADALAAGMVDRVGTLDTVIAKELPAGRKLRLRSENTDVSVESNEDTNVVLAPDMSEVEIPSLGSLIGIAATTSTANSTTMVPYRHPTVVPEDGFDQEGSALRGADDTTPKEGTMDERVTLEQLAARKEEIIAQMGEIHSDAQGRQFTSEEQNRFDELDEEQIEIEAAIENIREREARLAAVFGNQRRTASGDGAKPVRPRANREGSFYTNAPRNLPDNIFDLSAYRGYGHTIEEINGLYREAAQRAIEGMQFVTSDQQKAKGHAEELLNRDSKDAAFATRILTTGSPLYDRAFGKLVMGHPMSTTEEAAIKAAISNTGLGAETPVPVTIDPTVMLTSDGAVNPLRQISRNVTITGNKWQGISSDGVSVTYEAELAEVAAQTPTFTAPTAEVVKAHAYIEFSIEVDQDWGELRNNLRLMFQDAKDMKEAQKFLLGTGTNEPEGLLTALIADGTSIVYTATLNTFADSDLYKVKGALPPRFRSGAVWLANDEVYSQVRQFDTTGGASLWTQLASDRPAVLLGKPVYEASEMSSRYGVGNEEIMIYGDFGRGFIIVDRVGMNVELIPHVMGANRRPIGARALYAYFRNTSALLSANAFRVLTVKPT